VSALARIPIRWRLALAFAVVMAVVLGALGAFLYVRLERSLTAGLDETLELRAAALAAQIRSSRDVGPAGEEGITQVFDSRGRLVSSSPGGEAPILKADDFERAGAGRFTMETDARRVLVTRADGAVLAVGVSLDDRDEALRSLLAQLLVVGPLALLLASVGGYLLAAAALRPVEAMRGEAEVVSASEPGRRLTLPPAQDEIRRLGETLNRMLARLETALERERRFVADASHELRTPLAMLRAELDLALRRERTPAELDHAVRSAAEETERLSRIAEDLLVLARADGGDLPVRKERVVAVELIDGVADRFRPRVRHAGRVIDTAAEESLVLRVDRLRAEQAVGNLVDNALRHGRGRILVEARRDGGQIELHVRDEGPGFPPDLVERAFEPFSRGDAARTRQGAGLGLAIVDVIARAHGGAAHVAGADAWITFPGDS
jgi:two-component system, OmpR family, sensor kinase